MHEPSSGLKYPILFLNSFLCLLFVTLEVVSSSPLVVPPLYLIPIFFWLVYAPQLMPLTTIFIVGLIKDILTGAPVGISSLILVLMATGLVSQAEILKQQIKTVVWGFFGLFTIFYYLANYLVISLLQWQLIAPELNYISIMMLIIIYPIIVVGLLQLLKIPVHRARS